MASAPRKRKRITPTLVAVDAPDDTSAPDADTFAPVAAAAAGVVVEELEVVAKAVKQLQPLKVGGWKFGEGKPQIEKNIIGDERIWWWT